MSCQNFRNVCQSMLAINLPLMVSVFISDRTNSGRFYEGEVVEYDAKKKKHKV